VTDNLRFYHCSPNNTQSLLNGDRVESAAQTISSFRLGNKQESSKRQMALNGQVAIVTGSASGLGRGFAEAILNVSPLQ